VKTKYKTAHASHKAGKISTKPVPVKATKPVKSAPANKGAKAQKAPAPHGGQKKAVKPSGVRGGKAGRK
jgi:hypothetical protein